MCWRLPSTLSKLNQNHHLCPRDGKVGPPTAQAPRNGTTSAKETSTRSNLVTNMFFIPLLRGDSMAARRITSLLIAPA